MPYSNLQCLIIALACWVCCAVQSPSATAIAAPKHKQTFGKRGRQQTFVKKGVRDPPKTLHDVHESRHPPLTESFERTAMYRQVSELRARAKTMASEIAKSLRNRKATHEQQLKKLNSKLEILRERVAHLKFLGDSLRKDNERRRQQLEELSRSRAALMEQLRVVQSNMTRLDALLAAHWPANDSSKNRALHVLEELDEADAAQSEEQARNKRLQAVAKGNLLREHLAFIQNSTVHVQENLLKVGKGSDLSEVSSLTASFAEMEAEANATARVLDKDFESKQAIGTSEESALLAQEERLNSYVNSQKELAERLQAALSLLMSEQLTLQRRSDGLQRFLSRTAERAGTSSLPERVKRVAANVSSVHTAAKHVPTKLAAANIDANVSSVGTKADSSVLNNKSH